MAACLKARGACRSVMCTGQRSQKLPEHSMKFTVHCNAVSTGAWAQVLAAYNLAIGCAGCCCSAYATTMVMSSILPPCTNRPWRRRAQGIASWPG